MSKNIIFIIGTLAIFIGLQFWYSIYWVTVLVFQFFDFWYYFYVCWVSSFRDLGGISIKRRWK